tara:strand:+ start:7391 stop:12130 length:4740 start_codon:yes stop_codon:yes gene_type:complete
MSIESKNLSDNSIINNNLYSPGDGSVNNALDITMSINSNMFNNFSINEINKICDYKLKVNDNVFNDTEVLFKNSYIDTNKKQDFFNKTRANSLKIIENLNETILSYSNLKEFFKDKNITQEFYRIFYMQKPSKYFGKISNKGIQYITEENLSQSYLENSYLKTLQTDYFNFTNPDYLSESNSKEFLSFHVRDKVNYLDNFNINTFICQSFVNLAKSYSTISSGSLIKHFDIENVNTTDITGSKNIICETKNSLDLDFFSYISESSLFFDDESFFQNEILKSNNSLVASFLNDFNSSNDAFNMRFEDSATSANQTESLSTMNDPRRPRADLATQTSLTTVFSKENILKINAKRLLNIYEGFFKRDSLYNSNNNSYTIDTSKVDISYKEAILQIQNSLTDITSVDLSNLSDYTNKVFSTYIFNEALLNNNENFKTDFRFTSQFFEDEVFHVGSAERSEFAVRNRISTYINTSEGEGLEHLRPSISLQIINQNLSKNIGSIYYNNIPILSNRYKSLEDLSDIMSGEIISFSIKDISGQKKTQKPSVGIAIKTDSIVKKIKNKSLEKSNFDTTIFKELVKNIKNGKTNSRFISYADKEADSVKIVESDNALKDILFTSIDDEKFSNFDITPKNNNIIKYKGLAEKIANNFSSKKILKECDNITKFSSNYFKGKYFKSSTNLFRKILQDVLNDIKLISSDEKYFEKTINQLLYLNLFLKEGNEKGKDEVLNRFVEKAILKNSDCSFIIKNIGSYKYNPEDLTREDYEIDSSAEDWESQKLKAFRDFYKDLHETNKKYDEIQKSVFSSDNVFDLSSNFNYKKADQIKVNLSIYSVFKESLNETFEGIRKINLEDVYSTNNFYRIIKKSLRNSKFKIDFKLIRSILPFYYDKTYRSIDQLNLSGEEQLDVHMYLSDFNSRSVIKNKRYNSLDLPNNLSLKKVEKVLIVENNNDNIRSIVINDVFDKIIDNKYDFQTEDYIFCKITDLIIDIIKTIGIEEFNQRFETLEEVNGFIESNSFVKDFLHEILKVYSEIYFCMIKIVNHELTLQYFAQDIALSDNTSAERSEYFDFNVFPNLAEESFDYIGNLSQCENISNTKSKRLKDDLSSIISSQTINNILRDFQNAIDRSLSIDYYLNKKLTNSKSKTFINQIENVFSILVKSDYHQNIQLDLTQMILNYYKNNIVTINNEEIEEKVNSIFYFEKEKIYKNLFSDFFAGKLYERKNYLENISNKVYGSLSSREGQNDNFLSLVTEFKDLENQNIKFLIRSGIESNILDGDQYTVNIAEEIETLNKKDIFEISVDIIDHNRLDRSFLPLKYYFTPLLFDASNSYLIENIESCIGAYQFDFNTAQINKIYSNKDDFKQDAFAFEIVEKILIENQTEENFDENVQNSELLLDKIFEDAKKSVLIQKYIDVVKNINLSSLNFDNKISINTYQFLTSLQEEEFFNIFNREKEDVLSKFTLKTDFYEFKGSLKDYDIQRMLSVTEMMSESTFASSLLNNSSFGNFNFHVNPIDFVYIVQNTTNDLEEENIEGVQLLQDLSSIEKLSCSLKDVDLDFVNSNRIYKINDQNIIDNYSVSINIRKL